VKIWRRWINHYGYLHKRCEVALYRGLPIVEIYIAFENNLGDKPGIKFHLVLGWIGIEVSCFKTVGYNFDGRLLREVGFTRGQ
jgi:hypothetical protein